MRDASQSRVLSHCSTDLSDSESLMYTSQYIVCLCATSFINSGYSFLSVATKTTALANQFGLQLLIRLKQATLIHVNINSIQKEQYYSMQDITSQFFGYTQKSEPHRPSTLSESSFIQASHSLAFELSVVASKLADLELLIQKSGHLNKQQPKINHAFIQISSSFKQIDQRIRRLSVVEPDMRGSRSIRDKFKKSILIILESRFIELTLRHKKDYEQKVQLQASILSRKQGFSDGLEAPKIAANKYTQKSYFLPDDAQQMIEETTKKEYQEIEKSIEEISEMYKHMASIVKMHEVMIERIVENTDSAVDYASEGRRNLGQMEERERSNRKFIIRIFMILYAFVFIYINFLL